MLRQAATVAESGKRAAALKLYRQIVSEAPQSVAGWLGLADSLRNEPEKRRALETVLSLEPGNAEAQAELTKLDGGRPDSGQERVDTSQFDSSRDWLNEQTARQRFDILERPQAAPEAASPPEMAPADELEASAEPEATAVSPLNDLPVKGDEALFCYRHPNRETSLRCISCDRPICGRCAQHTPVGYRCPTCIREAQDVFYSATPLDYIVVTVVALPLSVLAGFLVSRFGGGFFFIFLMFFIGGAIGRFIGRVAHRAAGRRRGRYLPYVVATTIVVGVLVPLWPVLLAIVLGNFGALTVLLVPAIYLFVATSAAFYSMR